jgi:hypothetical protein
VVTAAHNKCIRDLLKDIQAHRKKSIKLVMVTTESEQTIGTLWEQEEYGGICSTVGRGRSSPLLRPCVASSNVYCFRQLV